MLENIPPEARAAGPGIAGAMVALMFLRRPVAVLAGMFVGGCVLAYIIGPWLSRYLELAPGGEAVASFLIGTFGMATTGKVFELVEAIEVRQLWKAIIDFIRKRLGLDPLP